MIDIPVHQKITYSRRRKIRAKEVSEKLEKLDKSDVGELQLRDWIYVKPLEGEQKSKFQIMRENPENKTKNADLLGITPFSVNEAEESELDLKLGATD